MFSFEFKFAPIDCFTWFAKMNVLDSKSHPDVALEAPHSLEFLQWLVLLCEFGMHCDYNRRVGLPDGWTNSWLADRNKGSSKESGKFLVDQYNKFTNVDSQPSLKQSIPGVSLTELENPASIQRFFENLNTYTTRFRVIRGTLASWIGMLCGGYMEVLHHADHKNLFIPIALTST